MGQITPGCCDLHRIYIVIDDVIRMSMKLLLIGLVFAAEQVDMAMGAGTFIARDVAVWLTIQALPPSSLCTNGTFNN